jgi:microcystin-dependent protein
MATPFIAEIRMFAGTFAPRGNAFCNGQLISIASNTALFSLLGTTYGGNGQTTFGLPNLLGRAPIGAGQGPGLSSQALGQTSGAATVTLTTTQVPAHTHTLTAGTVTPQNPAQQTATPGPTAFLGLAGPNFTYSDLATPAQQFNSGALGATGGSLPHENSQPYLVVNFIIATQGIFPSRN